jgi:hypothetical protein
MSTTQTTPAAESNTLHECQKARIKMANTVCEHILDPIMLFSEVLTTYNESKGAQFTLKEIGAAVRLLALGGMADMLMCGSSRYIDGDTLRHVLKDWIEIEEEYYENEHNI